MGPRNFIRQTGDGDKYGRGYEPPEPCPAIRSSSHTSHPVAAHTAGPSHRVSGVPAHHTTSYNFDYSPVSLTPGHQLILESQGWGIRLLLVRPLRVA